MCSSPNFEILKSSFSQGTERQIYEFVVRHFLACCSKVWIYMHSIGVYLLSNRMLKDKKLPWRLTLLEKRYLSTNISTLSLCNIILTSH